MQADDEPDSEEPLITAIGLGVDGEHGPLFENVGLTLAPGFHAIQMPGATGSGASPG